MSACVNAACEHLLLLINRFLEKKKGTEMSVVL